MPGAAATLRHELIGLSGVVERNVYLVKRYIWWDIAFFVWTVANTLTIVFIAKGIPAAGGHIDVPRITTILLVGAVIWAYLGIIFEILTETVAWERWEGTIEYTFMAPLSRPVHPFGMGLFAIVYGVVRAVLLFGVVAAFFSLHLPDADYVAALLLLDEPTTGLDPRSKLEVQNFIREVRAIHDTTILLCTHDLAEAEILAERIGILDDGELLCLEPADQLKARYNSTTLEEAFFTASGHAFENGDRGDD